MMYLSPGPDGEHAGLCADTPDLRPGGVGAQPGQQLVSDILHHRRRAMYKFFVNEQLPLLTLNSLNLGINLVRYLFSTHSTRDFTGSQNIFTKKVRYLKCLNYKKIFLSLAREPNGFGF
jgi:hypothetical protein